jgi:hypothetical protein
VTSSTLFARLALVLLAIGVCLPGLRPAAAQPTLVLAPWLRASIDSASQAAFGLPAAMMGEGGSIPFMGMLGEKFPAAQFVITGVLGPHSNAHGPNEFLHIARGKGVTLAVAQVLADHFVRERYVRGLT